MLGIRNVSSHPNLLFKEFSCGSEGADVGVLIGDSVGDNRPLDSSTVPGRQK